MSFNEPAKTKENKTDKESFIQREGRVQQNSAADDVMDRDYDNSNELSDNQLIKLVSIISANDTKTIALKYLGDTKVFIDDVEYSEKDVTQVKLKIFTHWRNKNRSSRQVRSECD